MRSKKFFGPLTGAERVPPPAPPPPRPQHKHLATPLPTPPSPVPRHSPHFIANLFFYILQNPAKNLATDTQYLTGVIFFLSFQMHPISLRAEETNA